MAPPGCGTELRHVDCQGQRRRSRENTDPELASHCLEPSTKLNTALLALNKMLARAALSRVSSAATTVAPRAVALRPRFLAAAGAQSFLVFDESTGPLSDLTDKADAKVITYFTAACVPSSGLCRRPSSSRLPILLLCRWCGPCRAIAPVLADLAAKNTGIKFVKIDVDNNSTTAGDVSISAEHSWIALQHCLHATSYAAGKHLGGPHIYRICWR